MNVMNYHVVETSLENLPADAVEILKNEATRRCIPLDALFAEAATNLANAIKAARKPHKIKRISRNNAS